MSRRSSGRVHWRDHRGGVRVPVRADRRRGPQCLQPEPHARQLGRLHRSLVHQAFSDPAVRSALWASVRVALAVDGDLAADRDSRRRCGRAAPAAARGRCSRHRPTCGSCCPRSSPRSGCSCCSGGSTSRWACGRSSTGHVVFNSAYATIIIQARVATLTTTLEEAARRSRRHARGGRSGASPCRCCARRSIVAGLLIFTFSFDDVDHVRVPQR